MPYSLKSKMQSRLKLKLLPNLEVPKSTFSTILKNREKIEAAYASNQVEPKHKRMRTAKNEDVEIALMRWIKEVRSQILTLTGGILQEKRYFSPMRWIFKLRLVGFSVSRSIMASYARKCAEKKQV